MRQQAPWTSEDVTAVQTIGNILGPVRVLIHEETRMTTETAPEDFTGGEDSGWDGATGANVAPTATYPEYPYSLADHVYTWSPKLPDGSMLVIRSQTADGLVEAVETVAPLAQRLTAAWRAVAAQPQAPAMAGGFQPAAAPQQFNQQPAQPFPNQPFPGQPAWQQAGAPQAPAPQWGGGGQQAGERKEGPAPQGRYKLNGARKEQVDASPRRRVPEGQPEQGRRVQLLRAEGGLGRRPGTGSKAGVVQGFAQYNPMAA
jgi:hypothetical protein